jgi:hypothetical protein
MGGAATTGDEAGGGGPTDAFPVRGLLGARRPAFAAAAASGAPRLVGDGRASTATAALAIIGIGMAIGIGIPSFGGMPIGAAPLVPIMDGRAIGIGICEAPGCGTGCFAGCFDAVSAAGLPIAFFAACCATGGEAVASEGCAGIAVGIGIGMGIGIGIPPEGAMGTGAFLTNADCGGAAAGGASTTTCEPSLPTIWVLSLKRSRNAIFCVCEAHATLS